jgi:hypothetical protein
MIEVVAYFFLACILSSLLIKIISNKCFDFLRTSIRVSDISSNEQILNKFRYFVEMILVKWPAEFKLRQIIANFESNRVRLKKFKSKSHWHSWTQGYGGFFYSHSF